MKGWTHEPIRAPVASLERDNFCSPSSAGAGLVHLASEGLEARLARGPVSGLHRLRRERAVAPCRSSPAGLPAPPSAASRRAAGRRHWRRHGHDRRPVGQVHASASCSTRPTIDANSAALRRSSSGSSTSRPGLPSRAWSTTAIGSRPCRSRLPARHRQALHGALHARQGLRAARLAAGMSFTEFSYQTLQAADFLHLHRAHGVDLQMGGADQWGNITAGLELIRRVEGRAEGADPGAFGLCSPLLLTRSGQKMGKSEKGAVYLDPALTSPYDFYQYWINDDDTLVIDHLRWLTTLESRTTSRPSQPSTPLGRRPPRPAGPGARPDRAHPWGDRGRPPGPCRGSRVRLGRGRPGGAGRRCSTRSSTSSSGPRPRPGRRSTWPWPPVPALVGRRAGSSSRAASRSTGSAWATLPSAPPAPVAGQLLVGRAGQEAAGRGAAPGRLKPDGPAGSSVSV